MTKCGKCQSYGKAKKVICKGGKKGTYHPTHSELVLHLPVVGNGHPGKEVADGLAEGPLADHQYKDGLGAHRVTCADAGGPSLAPASYQEYRA